MGALRKQASHKRDPCPCQEAIEKQSGRQSHDSPVDTNTFQLMMHFRLDEFIQFLFLKTFQDFYHRP